MMATTGLSQEALGITRIYTRPATALTHRSTSTHSAPSTHLPLAGEEILIKDLHQVQGETTTYGSTKHATTATHHDSTTTHLLNLGAVLVGASATSEYGLTAYTEPTGQEAPINPLGARFSPGGSSGGAAVAVARGLVRIAHATDGGGSIRIPAACCGLPGLKPAHDRTIGGFTTTAHGFLTRDLATMARAYQLPQVNLRTLIATRRRTPLRVGYTNTPFHSTTRVDPAIAAATAAATALLITAGIAESITRAPAPYPTSTFSLFQDYLASHCTDLPTELTPLTHWLKEQGLTTPHWRRSESLRLLLGVARQVQRNWKDLDLVATPMLACAPPAPGAFSALNPRLDFLAQTAWTPWGTLWNMAGWASLCIPLIPPEKVPGRWPIALQLGAVANRVSEAELLSAGQAIQQEATRLPPQMLSIATEGDVESLHFRPQPPSPHQEHHHGYGATTA